MQSNGGAVTAAEAPAVAISTVGSVLTGGVVGSLALGRQLGHRNIISTDVGGTTFLVGLIVDGEPVRATTTIINHHPINVPTLRVDAIGSGGGAIAWLDSGGNLRIGPRSAQAVPGPACYGQGGTEPTNTDANLVLGILPERGLLGGRKPLSAELARQAINTQIAKPLGLSVEDAAAAIYAVQNAQTGDLLRKTVVEAGHDPREFVLYAFGGAGPAHCADYAAEVGVAEVVVPLGPVASAFSAFGLASSDIALAAELSDPTPIPFDPARAERNFAELEDQVRDGLDRQGVEFGRRRAVPRDRHAVLDAARRGDRRRCQRASSTTRRSRRPQPAFEERYADAVRRGCRVPRGRHPGDHLPGARRRGSCRSPRGCPTMPSASSSDPAEARTGSRPVCLDGARGLRRHPDLRLRRCFARATGSPARRSSRCRPPPSSFPTARPAPSTSSAT